MESLEILIVDDSASLRLYLRDILSELNVNLTEAIDGIDAFNKIKAKKFGLILMDIEMPGLSGLEVTEKVRKELKYLYTPIIIMTALKTPELIKTAFNIGATDYIGKPLSKDEVLARVNLRLEHRRLERELVQAKTIAENASYAKSEFISRLAHELKTPLNAISGFTQLIQLETESTNILESCDFVLTAVKHQEDLINEVTNLAKIEAGVIDINLEDVQLAAIIKEAFNLTTPMANKFQVRLNFPKYSTVTYKLRADHLRLKQIFINLLSNAIKYNKIDGDVNILVKPVSTEILKIGIADTGKGIAKKDIPKLFEAFNRLGAENTEIEGTGVGLPITKKLMELMGGSLQVESIEGKGTVFWIELVIA